MNIRILFLEDEVGDKQIAYMAENDNTRGVFISVGNEECLEMDFSGVIDIDTLEGVSNYLNTSIIKLKEGEIDEFDIKVIRPTLCNYAVIEKRCQSLSDSNPQSEISYFYDLDEANDYRRDIVAHWTDEEKERNSCQIITDMEFDQDGLLESWSPAAHTMYELTRWSENSADSEGLYPSEEQAKIMVDDKTMKKANYFTVDEVLVYQDCGRMVLLDTLRKVWDSREEE